MNRWLSFLAFSVEGPLGLILLGATLAFVAIFAIYAILLRTSVLVETRRHLKELEVQRQLADTAEASRITALSAELERAGASVRAALEETRADNARRADALEQTLLRAFSENEHSLSASLGQVDDKLDRIAGGLGRDARA